MSSRSLAVGLAVLSVLFLGRPNAWAEDFRLKLGAQFQGWWAHSLDPYHGREFWLPFSLTYRPSDDLKFILLTKFGNGNYTHTNPATSITQTLDLTALSDTVVGGVGTFTHFGVPALVDIRLNLPTGDPSWEGKQIPASIPTEFIGSRYQGRSLGLSAFYGLSFPEGESSLGAGVGYLYTEAFVTDQVLDSLSEGLRLGDAVFLVINRLESFKGGKSSRIRLTGTYYLTTQEGGEDIFQMGPSLNLSYAFQDPSSFSYEVGAQFFTSARRLDPLGEFVEEPANSFGQRFYFVPSLKLSEDWDVSGRFKFILPNGYQDPDTLFNAGGFLVGLEPSYRVDLGEGAALRLSVSYDNVLHISGGHDTGGNLLDISYERWVLGTEYQVGF